MLHVTHSGLTAQQYLVTLALLGDTWANGGRAPILRQPARGVWQTCPYTLASLIGF
jgi:hypothetical protein